MNRDPYDDRGGDPVGALILLGVGLILGLGLGLLLASVTP